MVRPKVVLPEQGISKEQLFQDIKELSKDDIVWKEGRVWSLVYHASDEHTEMLKKTYNMFFSKNAFK